MLGLSSDAIIDFKQSEEKNNVNERGERLITGDHEMLGKRVSQVSDKLDIEILLVLRGELSLFPTDNLVLQKNDIVVLKSGRVIRKPGSSDKLYMKKNR